MGYHLWTVLLDLVQTAPVELSAALTLVGVLFAIVIKWIIHGDQFSWAHLMVGSDLSLAGILVALVQGFRIESHDHLTSTVVIATGQVLPVIFLTILGTLSLLVSVNIERLAHQEGTKTGPIRFFGDLAFGAMVAGTSFLLHF